ncbi:hypothetical protein ACFY3U_11580, partial [Micromonospora sp. NPDC000089]
TSDGTVFDRFDGDNRPIHGIVDGQLVSISYGTDGESTWTFGDGSGLVRNADGDLVRQTTADGTVFDRFDGDNRPVHGLVDGQPVSISYGGNGESTWTYSDGSALVRNADGNAVRQTTPDGTVFDQFDGDNRPTHGVLPARDGQPAQDVSITYGPDGSNTWTYGDGTVIKRDGADKLTSMQSDGWTFETFDDQDRPTAGTEAGTGKTVKVVYAKDGSSVWTYSDGSIVTRDANGELLTMQTNGWTYDEFDSEGRPTHGYDRDGKTVDIRYTADGLVESTFGGGNVMVTDSDGNPIYQIVNGEKAEYAVEIPKLGAAIKKIEGERDLIEGELDKLKSWFENVVGGAWMSPSGTKYQELSKDMVKLTTDTRALLDDAILAMQKSYDTYVGAEGTNLKNLTIAK